MQSIRVIDSHTVGEPTRLIIEGGPDLGRGLLADRLQTLRTQFDCYRTAVVGEPRRFDGIVGGLLCEPVDKTCLAGIIFFDGVGYLGMCVHGTIGLISSLAYLNKIAPGQYKIETPVGIVTTELHRDGQVSVHNVPAYRWRKHISIYVAGIGRVTGDIAWGGNWFFLVNDHPLSIDKDNIDALIDYTLKIRRTLHEENIKDEAGNGIDYIQLFAQTPTANSRNFVLCPGTAFDRSPCGTGTSAKLACLAADNQLQVDETWLQESITGSQFEARYQPGPNGHILPVITSQAHVNADSKLIIDAKDPFAWGVD